MFLASPKPASDGSACFGRPEPGGLGGVGELLGEIVRRPGSSVDQASQVEGGLVKGGVALPRACAANSFQLGGQRALEPSGGFYSIVFGLAI
jgi:hypothetical protein